MPSDHDSSNDDQSRATGRTPIFLDSGSCLQLGRSNKIPNSPPSVVHEGITGWTRVQRLQCRVRSSLDLFEPRLNKETQAFYSLPQRQEPNR